MGDKLQKIWLAMHKPCSKCGHPWRCHPTLNPRSMFTLLAEKGIAATDPRKADPPHCTACDCGVRIDIDANPIQEVPSDYDFALAGWCRCRNTGDALLGHLWNTRTSALATILNPPETAELPEEACKWHRRRDRQ